MAERPPANRRAVDVAIADALLVTPLIDGMNLVAMEYVIVQHARRREVIGVVPKGTIRRRSAHRYRAARERFQHA